MPDSKLESPSYPLAGVFGELWFRGVRGESGIFCTFGIVPVLDPLSKVAFDGTGGGRRLSGLKENLSSKQPPPGGVFVYIPSAPVSSSPVSFIVLKAKILSILLLIFGFTIGIELILRQHREEWTTAGLLAGAPSQDWCFWV